MKEIALIQAPWGTGISPSMGLHILRDVLKRERRVEASIFYDNFEFYEVIDECSSFNILKDYFWEDLCLFWLSEGMFAPYAHEADVASKMQERFLNHVSKLVSSTPNRHQFPKKLHEWMCGNVEILHREIVETIPKYLDGVAERLVKASGGVYGFSVFFNQLLPSISLTRQIKYADPTSTIVFGGACITAEAAPEILRSFECVDFIVEGEGEVGFKQIVDAANEVPTSVCFPQNVYVSDSWLERSGCSASTEQSSSSEFPKINGSDYPDYSEFYETRNSTRFDSELTYLPFELSRVCYWAYKSKCTICGIADNFPFRNRSPSSAVEHVKNLYTHHEPDYLVCVDSAVPKNHIKRTFPAQADFLAKLDRKLKFFVRNARRS